MFVIGKIIGVLLGFLMGKATGAFLGFIVGNIFDSNLKRLLNQTYAEFFLEKRPPVVAAFIKTTACLMGLIAKADGRVSEQELHFAQHIFKTLKLKPEQRQTAIQWFTSSKNGQISFTDHVRMLKNIKDTNLKLCHICLDIVYQMAKIDGLSHKKLLTLNELLSQVGFAHIKNIFGFEESWQNFHNEQRAHSSYHQSSAPKNDGQMNLERAYTILNIKFNANKAEVKKAYRRLMSQYHPDRMIAKGASKQELKTATEKTQEISKAYQIICTAKNW